MKTLFKNFKTVAAIILALVIYSCNDELIEQQDVSNTNQEFSKKPKKPTKYCGNFVEGTITGAHNLLISKISGNSSSHNFTTQWQTSDEVWDEEVLEVINGDGDKYYPRFHVGFHVYKKAGEITGFQIFLKDKDYRFATDNTPLIPTYKFPAANSEVEIKINTTVELWRYFGKGNKRESVGDISIGSLKYVLKDDDCDCWDLKNDDTCPE